MNWVKKLQNLQKHEHSREKTELPQILGSVFRNGMCRDSSINMKTGKQGKITSA